MDFIKEKVCDLIENYSTRDPFELCSALGVFVFFAELPDRVKGFYYKVKDYQIIGVNSGLCRKEQRIVCAHELGHAVFHPDMNLFFAIDYTNLSTEKYEKQADYFCACLLIDEAVAEKAKKENELLTLSNLSSMFELPNEIVEVWLSAGNSI